MKNRFNNALVSLFAAITLIVAGGICTYFTAYSVHVHLREGECNTSTNTFLSENLTDSCSNDKIALPFTIRLERFEIQYHEGTRTPKDYISHITIIDPPVCDISGQQDDSTGKTISVFMDNRGTSKEVTARISMNKIMKYQKHRIFQEDYDQDLKGSVLLVRYDPWGTTLVYSGFILLLISMLWLLLQRNGAFRRLLRTLSLCPLLMLSFSSLYANSEPISNSSIGNITDSTILIQTSALPSPHQDTAKISDSTRDKNSCIMLNSEEAKAFGQLSVYYKGRIAPFDSYARDYCKAVFPRGTIPTEYTPVQLVINIYMFPERWQDKPAPSLKLFPQQSLWLAPEDDLSTAAPEDILFIAHILDWLRQSVQEEHHEQNIQIINSISTFQEKRCTPGSINRQREHLEILYYQFKPERKIFLVEIIMAIALFFMMLFTTSESLWEKRVAQISIFIGLVLTMADISLRCYLSGHNPFSGTFDTLMLLSAGILLIGFVISMRKTFMALPTLIASAFITLAATMIGGNSFSPLMPVLISPWLTIHVAIIMSSYCFLILCFVLAIISIFMILLQKEKYKSLKIKQLSQIFCILGVVFLATGIMVGSAWANISWGQYWSWDPKETWALITLLGYSLALPGVIPATEKHDLLYHIVIIVAFLLLLTTYFGVNIWMGGMHAY